MQRLIDLDVAIKDARLNYGGVHDTVLMEHFLKSQPVVTPTAELDRSRWEGCEWCKEYSGPFMHQNGWKYCPLCGRPLTDQAWQEIERRINDGTDDMEERH